VDTGEEATLRRLLSSLHKMRATATEVHVDALTTTLPAGELGTGAIPSRLRRQLPFLFQEVLGRALLNQPMCYAQVFRVH
jgi:hypothetical protein